MSTLEEELLRDLMQTFQVEAAEHLQTLNQAVLQLERQPEKARRQELLQDAFRAAHSLKGAARAVSLQDVESLAHAMESVLQDARDANTILDAKTCDVFYDTLDAMQQLIGGQTVSIAPLLARLSADSGDAPAVGATLIQTAPETMTTITPVEGTIRVAVNKLDDLMAQTGELLVSKISAEQRLTEMQAVRRQLAEWPKTWRDIKAHLSRVDGETGQLLADLFNRHHEHLQAFTEEINALDQSLGRDTVRLGMVTNQLQDEVRRVRMIPFQTLALVLERAVRDAARSEDKQVALHIAGGDVELDKKVLETLKDPLLHILRNAVSHGLEMPEARVAAGKPAEGKVIITVRQRGGEVSITVRDDGQGFDLDALRQASMRNGGPAFDDKTSVDEIIALAFLPGVTTVQKVTAIAGRGVGLDVVRQSLESLQGRSEVETVTGEGATVRLLVPVSLTMTRGLLVRIGAEHYVLPLLAVEKIVEPSDSFTIEGQLMLPVDDTPVPLVLLSAVLERSGPQEQNGKEALAVVLNVAQRRLALLVDDVLTEQELAVKPLGNPLQRVRNVVGAALLGTGEPVLILNAADLVKSARGAHTPVSFITEHDVDITGLTAHILVVDDSITTRTLEKNILEAAGYRVTTAIDGLEALNRLEEHTIDLIVSDIQMPNMDGFIFTQQVRESDAYNSLPVILVTSLEKREDREQGMLAGADAYIVKRGFDQAELLATIEQFL